MVEVVSDTYGVVRWIGYIDGTIFFNFNTQRYLFLLIFLIS